MAITAAIDENESFAKCAFEEAQEQEGKASPSGNKGNPIDGNKQTTPGRVRIESLA